MRKRKRNNDENSDKTGYRVQDDYDNDEANTPVRSDTPATFSTSVASMSHRAMLILKLYPFFFGIACSLLWNCRFFA